MNKKNILGIIAVLLFTSTIVFGQHKPNREKIKTLKTAFITERLDLSSEEAQSFWPVYNEHESKMHELYKKDRIHRNQNNNIDSISDEEAKDLLLEHLKVENDKHKLHSSFIEKISTVLSPKKALLLISIEKDFRRELIKMHRQKRMGERK